MHGVVSLLDEKHYSLVEAIWSDLQKELGVQGLCRTPFPHFSYHIAQHYDLSLIEPLLKKLARSTNEFQVKTAGLGIFSGQHPVLYIPVVRSQELSRLHAEVWDEVEKASEGSMQYYRSEMWVPHITVADEGRLTEHLTQIVSWLSGREYIWEIAVGNFALIYDNGTKQEVRLRFDLGV